MPPSIPSIVVQAPRALEDQLYLIWWQHGFAGLTETECTRGVEWNIFFAPDTNAALLAMIAEELRAVDPEQITVALASTPQEDWSHTWRKFFEPLTIAPGIVITAPDADFRAAAHERVIQINPGMAFGTGQHATTELVARALVKNYSRAEWPTLLDMGCGSGILALIAATLGVPHVHAIDNDPDALIACRENAERNQLSDRLVIAPHIPADTRFAAIAANILIDPLCEFAPRFWELLEPGGDCFLSGVLIEEQERLRARFTAIGFCECAVTHNGEWMMLHTQRPR